MLTIEDIDNLARLARIELGTEEKIKLQKEMESILNYVSELGGVDPKSVSHGAEKVLTNVMREDEATIESEEYTEGFLANTPKREGNYVAVKAIFEDR